METHHLKAQRIVPAVVTLAFSVAFLSWAYTYGERARQVPVLVGWVMSVLCALDVVASSGTGIGSMIQAFFTGTVVNQNNGSATGGSAGRTAAAMLWPTAFVILVWVFGFIPVIPVYVFLFVVIQGRKPLRQGVIAAVATTTFIYVVFELLLRYEVYRGIVFSD